MSTKVHRRTTAIGLAACLVVMTITAGCNLFGPRTTPQQPQTRPSPTRPTGRQTRTPLKPAPTKQLPGAKAVDAKELGATVDRIKKAIDKNDWAAATRETNSLGTAWTKFKPSKKGTMSATEMKNFDTNYAKLQKDVRAKNKSGATRDVRALKDSVTKMTK